MHAQGRTHPPLPPSDLPHAAQCAHLRQQRQDGSRLPACCGCVHEVRDLAGDVRRQGYVQGHLVAVQPRLQEGGG